MKSEGVGLIVRAISFQSMWYLFLQSYIKFIYDAYACVAIAKMKCLDLATVSSLTLTKFNNL